MTRLRDPPRHRSRCGDLPVLSAAGGVRADADVARRAKGRQSAPGAARLPLAASQLRASTAPPCSQRFSRVALSRRDGQPYPGALRAPLKM